MSRRALWAGRTAALLAITLLALNLRSAVAAISPITDQIGPDVELTTIGIGLIGALPPVFFALAGVIAPPIARRLGLELSVLLAVVLIIAGHLIRAFAGSYSALVVGSALALGAMGIANVLLPPVVKRYFHDKIGVVTATYVTLMSISTAIPAMSAAPLADGLGWRTSLGIWSLTAAVAAVPWLLVYTRRHHDRPGEAAPIVVVPDRIRSQLWRSRTAWAIAMIFGVSSVNAYAMFAWLPRLLVDTAGVTHVEAGALLALYSFIAVPGSILAPVLVVRLHHPAWLIHAGVAFFLLGYTGLLFAPQGAPWLWVALAGIGPILFPVALTLINARTHSQQVSTALSGFVQGIGYSVAALSPPLIGLMHEGSGGWALPIVALCLVSATAVYAGVRLATPRFVEDDFSKAA